MSMFRMANYSYYREAGNKCQCADCYWLVSYGNDIHSATPHCSIEWEDDKDFWCDGCDKDDNCTVGVCPEFKPVDF